MGDTRDSSCDAVVVGSGIAGLRAAIEIGRGGGRVAILTKDGPTDSATDKAQGGLAAVLSDDDEVSLHYQDTILAGDGLCHEGAVRVLVEEGPARALELIDWGARFDREGTRVALAREAAHSKRRILRARGDSTGREIVRVLVARSRADDRITLLQRIFSVDLILAGGRCAGILALDEDGGRPVVLRTRAVVLATGGAGQVYQETTNPPQATGDGMAMAYRAGAEMSDMEFVQFHPTALALPGAPRFLLSEAMRGEGGRLEHEAGERFMPRHDSRGDLAPRDIVAPCVGATRGGPLPADRVRGLSIDPESAGPTIQGLRRLMSEGAGIIRSGAGLERSVAAILELERGLAIRPVSRRGVEARNLLFVGRLIVESALRRQESRGAHFREDFPRKEPGRGRHSIIAPWAPASDLPRILFPDSDWKSPSGHRPPRPAAAAPRT